MPPRPHSPPTSSLTSNLRLFLLGIALTFLSILYPRLPLYLPTSVTNHLPFLPSALPDTPHHSHWTSTHRYQASIPIAKDFDPFDKQGEEEELKLRLLSREGQTQADKQRRRELELVERRAETAGKENEVHVELPVYFLQQGTSEHSIPSSSPLGIALAAVGDEILDLVRPKTLIFLSPVRTEAEHLLVSTASYLSPTGSSAQVTSSPSLASSLLTAFASSRHHSVPAIPSHSTAFPAPAWPVYQALFGHRQDARLEVVHVGLPSGAQWSENKWEDVGLALHSLRRSEGDVVIIGVGSTRPSTPSNAFPHLLHQALAEHTLHARVASLASLFANAGGSGKPSSKGVKQLGLIGLYAAVGAAGESEGTEVGRGGWRFGALPEGPH